LAFAWRNLCQDIFGAGQIRQPQNTITGSQGPVEKRMADMDSKEGMTTEPLYWDCRLTKYMPYTHMIDVKINFRSRDAKTGHCLQPMCRVQNQSEIIPACVSQ
jgi:hypothetical protein